MAGVEFGRGLPVVPVMSQDRRHRSLRIGPGPGVDASSLTQSGVSPVRRDHETRLDRWTIGKGDGGQAVARLEARSLPGQDGQVHIFPGGLRQPFDERRVLDVPAEGVETDFMGGEGYRRRPEEAARIVHDSHGRERRGVRRQPGPDTQGLEETDRAVEQGHRAPVPPGVQSADESRPEAVTGEGKGGAQADGAGAHDGNVIGLFGHGSLMGSCGRAADSQ
jgi:hypothetical protein